MRNVSISKKGMFNKLSKLHAHMVAKDEGGMARDVAMLMDLLNIPLEDGIPECQSGPDRRSGYR